MTIQRIVLSVLSEEARDTLKKKYMEFCHPLWREAYAHEGLKVTKAMIDREFREPGLQDYFGDLFAEDRIVWIDFGPEGEIQGGVSLQYVAKDGIWKMQGLYVAGKGQGTGTRLFNEVVAHVGERPIVFEVPWYFEAAREFYPRRGCVPTGKLVDYPWIDPGMREHVLGMEMRYQA